MSGWLLNVFPLKLLRSCHKLLDRDIKALENDYMFKKSCGETELLPFIS